MSIIRTQKVQDEVLEHHSANALWNMWWIHFHKMDTFHTFSLHKSKMAPRIREICITFERSGLVKNIVLTPL